MGHSPIRSLCTALGSLRTWKLQGMKEQRTERKPLGLLGSVTVLTVEKACNPPGAQCPLSRRKKSSTSLTGQNSALAPSGHVGHRATHHSSFHWSAGDRITEEADGRKSPRSMETLRAELIEPKRGRKTAQRQCSNLGMRKPPPKGGQKERRELEKDLNVSNLVCKLGA